MSNQPQPKKHNAFELVYVKDGYYYGSYDLFPSDNDTKLIKLSVWKGFEKPEPIGPVPTGNKEIVNTAQTDVADYATAQVVDANLLAENIKKDITILGITGTLEGGSGDLDELQ